MNHPQSPSCTGTDLPDNKNDGSFISALSDDVGDDKKQLFGPVSLEELVKVEDLACHAITTTSSGTGNDVKLLRLWSRVVDALREFIVHKLLFITTAAAKNPYQCVILMIFLPLFLIGIGLFTNFEIEIRPEKLYTTYGSKTLKHMNWLEQSAFPKNPRSLRFLIHANGGNVLGKEGVRLVFKAVDMVRETEGYDDICSQSVYVDPITNQKTCNIISVGRYWNNSLEVFEEAVETDADAITTMSMATYPDGTPVNTPEIISYAKRNFLNAEEYASAKSFIVTFDFPRISETVDFETKVLDEVLKVKKVWEKETAAATYDPSKKYNKPLKVEVLAERSLEDETTRAIYKDMPLIPAVFVIMTAFTCSIFGQRDRVRSRSLLALGAVFCILLSIMTAYGVLFILGVRMSLLSQLLPFVIFGVGLDDTFILVGAYNRYPIKDPVQRIRHVIEEVGFSLTMTTVTTSIAFGLGCTSAIPAVSWMGYYAFTCVMMDFLYQVTFFIAILVLDERRMQSNRYDCCFWSVRDVPIHDGDNTFGDDGSYVKGMVHGKDVSDHPLDMEIRSGQGTELSTVRKMENENISDVSSEESLVQQDVENQPEVPQTPPLQSLHIRSHTDNVDPVPYSANDDNNNNNNNNSSSRSEKHDIHQSFVERFMTWYADRVLQPRVKVGVLIFFAGFFACCAYRATLLTPEFKISSVVPRDSYALRFVDAFEQYGTRVLYAPHVYFRDVDQSDPEVWDQMEQFVHEIVRDVNSIEFEPHLFWLRDFKQFVELSGPSVADLPFTEQLDLFLEVPIVKQLYSSDIVRDTKTGDIISSRCMMYMTNLDVSEVSEQIGALKQTSAVSQNQTINRDESEWKFFTYEDQYYLWQFLIAIEDEVLTTTFIGIVAVSSVSFFFMPHWSAALFIFPFISVLYTNLIGVMQFSGLHINGVTYLALIMSIGLLVDFLMHYLLRYYESTELTREDKVKDALKSMGSSILLGGLSTLLGIIPLAFSASDLLRTLFVSFCAMVSLGVSHGLILLPVLLSYLGPVNTCDAESTTTAMVDSKKSKLELSPSTTATTSTVTTKNEDGEDIITTTITIRTIASPQKSKHTTEA